MIIVRDEENAIVEMFDTAKEFKKHIDEALLFLENVIQKEDEDFTFALFDRPIENVSFEIKFKQYKEMTNNGVEII